MKKIKEHFPGKPIVILLSERFNPVAKKMFEAGAIAYLLKSSERRNEIRQTLEKVFQGMTVFTGMIEPDREQAFRSGFGRPQVHPDAKPERICYFFVEWPDPAGNRREKKTLVSQLLRKQ